MNPQAVLRRAREHTLAHRHEEALADFLWFHHHALEHDQAYYGVRLSFALAYWHELAREFPAAADALRSVRDSAADEVLRGKGNTRELFNDVAAIDLELGRTAETYQLFKTLRKKSKNRAEACADLAISCIVDAADYELASRLLPPPELYLLGASDLLNDNLNLEASSKEMARAQREAFLNNYCEDVRLLLRTLSGCGQTDSEHAARVWAVALVEDRRARDVLLRELG